MLQPDQIHTGIQLKGHNLSLKYILLVLSALAISVLFINPLFVADDLHDSTRMGKIFFFTKWLALFAPILIFPIILNIKQKPGILQIFVFLFMIWIVTRGKTGGILNDEKFFWLIGCMLFFFLSVQLIKILVLHQKQTVIFIPVIVIVVVALLEGVFGQLQILGKFPVYHNRFIVSGTFFNPAPYAGFLVASLPWTICLFSIKRKSEISKIISYLGFAAALVILLIIPATRSRAAYLGALVILSIWVYNYYKPINYLKKFIKSKQRAILAVSLVFIVLTGAIFGLFKMKSDSALGRVLIWKVAMQTSKKKPLLGHGFNTFQAVSTPALAEYFELRERSEKEQNLADNIPWAFNEPLQILSELGIVGLVISILIFYFALFKGRWKDESSKNPLVFFARLSLMGIIVFSLFSYPFYSVSTTLLFFFSISVIAAQEKEIARRLLAYLHSIVVVVMLFAVFVYYNQQTPVRKKAYWLWNEAEMLYNNGYYKEAGNSYAQVAKLLPSDGKLLQQYAKCLVQKEEYKVAIEILEKGKHFYTDEFWYITMGDSYKGLKNYARAEYYYKQAGFAVPHKFYPDYLLAKLYIEAEQPGKAKVTAQHILNKKVKVQSTAIEEIKEEMRKIVE